MQLVYRWFSTCDSVPGIRAWIMRWTGTRVTAESAPCEKKNAAGGGPVVLFAALCVSPINHLPVLVPHSVCERGTRREAARAPPACRIEPKLRNWSFCVMVISASSEFNSGTRISLCRFFFSFPLASPSLRLALHLWSKGKEQKHFFFFFYQIGCRTYVKPLIYSPIEPRLLKEISC